MQGVLLLCEFMETSVEISVPADGAVHLQTNHVSQRDTRAIMQALRMEMLEARPPGQGEQCHKLAPMIVAYVHVRIHQEVKILRNPFRLRSKTYVDFPFKNNIDI
jgi:hypothetical protein